MAKNPSSVWYWNDWALDPAVRLCSMAARGMWMEMLAIAAAATPYGHVQVGDKPCSADDLAQLTGQRKQDVSRWIRELDTNGVFSRTEDGTIFCRRMVRETEQRQNKRKKAKVVRPPSNGKEPDLLDNPTLKPEKQAESCASPDSDSDSDSVPKSVSSETESPCSNAVPPKTGQPKKIPDETREEGVSRRTAPLEDDLAPTRRAKRLNMIKTLRRWVVSSPHQCQEDQADYLTMLGRAEYALDDWNSRTLADKHWLDQLKRKADRLPLDEQTVSFHHMAEYHGVWRSKRFWATAMARTAAEHAAAGMPRPDPRA